jgi:hypothetical protein
VAERSDATGVDPSTMFESQRDSRLIRCLVSVTLSRSATRPQNAAEPLNQNHKKSKLTLSLCVIEFQPYKIGCKTIVILWMMLAINPLSIEKRESPFPLDASQGACSSFSTGGSGPN